MGWIDPENQPTKTKGTQPQPNRKEIFAEPADLTRDTVGNTWRGIPPSMMIPSGIPWGGVA